MEKINQCPICKGSQFKEILHGKDHFLSDQEFIIEECLNCGFKFTNPRPDKTEIVSFYESPEYISHNAAKGTLFEALYKFVRKFALRNKYQIVKQYSTGNDLLDIGCGTGEFLNYCRKKGYKTTGIEPNDKAGKFGIEKFKLNIFNETQLDQFPLSSFDIITLWHVLEHVHNINERILKIYQLLKQEGTLVLAVPNCNSYDAKKFRKYWAAYDLPRHLFHFTNESVKLIVEKHGFKIIKIIPLKLDAFYISLLSQKYQNGKKNYFMGVMNGIKSNYYAKRHDMNYSSMIYICKIA